MSEHQRKGKHRFSLFSIFFTFFIDNLGATIIFPIFAPLFLRASTSVLSNDLSYNVKAAVLGLFLGAYPFAQLLCAPIIGDLADRHGRKLAFLVTTALSLMGYVLCAISIQYKWISLLFISRLMMGASAGNLSLCLSALSDLSSSSKQKVKYYGIGSVIAGVTFVLGPFMGGKLSDPMVHEWFNLAFPMWIGAFLALTNWVFLAFAFIETHRSPSKEPFDLIKGFHNIQTAFKTPSIKKLYLMYFFYLLSWNMLFQFIPAFLVANFSVRNSMIGDISALMGLAWVIGSIVLYRGLLPYFKPKTLLVVGGFGFAVIVLGCSLIFSVEGFSIVLACAVLVASFGWPLCAGAISNAAHGAVQGKILGLSQSMQSLTMMIAPIVVGPFLSKHAAIPFFLSAAASIVFGFLALLSKKQAH